MSSTRTAPAGAFRTIIATALLLPALAACQMGGPSRILSLKSQTGPTDIILAIGKAAQTCWFAKNETAFATYRLADEVNSHSGRPRLLLVPKHDPSALPVLVIQAETKGDAASGTYSDVQAYGPLLSSPHASRITGDVQRWASGDMSCA